MAKIQKSKVFDAAEAAQEIKPVVAPDQFKVDGKAYTVFDQAEAAQEIKPVVAPDQFKVDGKAYTYAMPKINLPGVGIRTALECILDKESYAELGGKTINEFLVSIGSGAVKEI